MCVPKVELLYKDIEHLFKKTIADFLSFKKHKHSDTKVLKFQNRFNLNSFYPNHIIFKPTKVKDTE